MRDSSRRWCFRRMRLRWKISPQRTRITVANSGCRGQGLGETTLYHVDRHVVILTSYGGRLPSRRRQRLGVLGKLPAGCPSSLVKPANPDIRAGDRPPSRRAYLRQRLAPYVGVGHICGSEPHPGCCIRFYGRGRSSAGRIFANIFQNCTRT